MNDCCLIVSFYDGPRRGDQSYHKEYLKANKETLKLLKHNLSRIVFVLASDDITKPRIVEEVNGELDGITYLYRPNKNFSFGSWVHAMNEFDHDYYILSEDDYVFVEHNFDTILIEEYEESKAEYLVVWKQTKSVVDPKSKKELMSTIGILNRETAQLRFPNYNETVKSNKKASKNMLNFINKFKTLGTLKKKRFHPYWTGNYVFIHGKKRYDRIFKNTISSCYQFYVKNKKKFIK